MGYTKDAVKGVSWIGLLSVLTKAIGFIEILILAKILVPAQFGAYSIALIGLGLLETLTETGVNVILLQEKEIDNFIDSAWIVSIIRGFVISGILFLTAPFISSFFNSKESLILLYLISIVPVLRGFINPAIVKFQKNLEFNKNFFYQFAILVFDTFISIILTYITKSPIGIVSGLIFGVLLELIISYVFVKPLPQFNFKKDYILLIFHRGKWITAHGIFDYLFHNLDNIVVGRILGPSSLGIYQLAYSIAVVPLNEIGKVFVHVSTPILVKISSEKFRLKNAFLKIVFSSFILSLPFSIILLFFPNIFTILLGSKWNSLVLILPVLSLLGLTKAVTETASAIFLSEKKQQYLTTITFANISVFALLIIPFVVRYGNFGAGLAGLISAIISIPFLLFFLLEIFKEE